MPRIDDPRAMTNLDTHAYLEAAKAWGAESEKWRPADMESMRTAMWECCLVALGVYEYERGRAVGQRTESKSDV